MTTNEIKFKEEISNTDFDSVIDICSSDPEFKKTLLAANVLIIPTTKDSKNNNIFPVDTTVLYRYLQQKSSNPVKLDIATKDEDYEELVQHSNLVNLPTMIVTKAILSIIIGLITSYIYDKLKSDGNTIRSKIIISNEIGDNMSFEYEGPANEYGNTMSKIFK